MHEAVEKLKLEHIKSSETIIASIASMIDDDAMKKPKLDQKQENFEIIDADKNGNGLINANALEWRIRESDDFRNLLVIFNFDFFYI